MNDTEPTKRPKWRRRAWIVAWSLLALVGLIIGLAVGLADNDSDSGPSAPPAAPAAPPAPRTAADIFEACVSAWDGNHDGFEDLIRDKLNDPSSMETHGTYYDPADDLADGEITIRLNYGARNALGGMVRSDAFALMRLDCTIAAVLDYGF